MPIALIASLVASFSVILVFVGIFVLRGESPVKTRLSEFGARPPTLEELELALPFRERIIQPFVNTIARFVTRFIPARYVQATRARLELAGNPYGWTSTYFLGVRGLVALLFAVLPILVATAAGRPMSQRLLFGLLVGLLGFNLPTIWLGSKVRARKNQVLRSLPDVLDLLTISVEAGLGFDAAVGKVTEKWDNELSRLFARMLAETRMGVPRRDAMRNMAGRVEVPEVTSLVAAIIQADQLGVSIAKVLRIQSEQMRVRRRQRAEERAMRAPLLMTFPLVLLIFPSIYIILLGPSLLIFLHSGVLGSVF
jgi:tight adherence protein C